MPEPSPDKPVTQARAWVAEPDEAPTVARLIGSFRDSYGREKPADNALLAGVQRLIDQPTETEYLLASPDDDSPPFGVAQLRFRFCVWTSAVDCWLEDLYVQERARRRGIADTLMKLAFERARAHGARRMELDTAETNEPALALYRRHGFSDRSKGNDGRDILLGVPVARRT